MERKGNVGRCTAFYIGILKDFVYSLHIFMSISIEDPTLLKPLS